MRSIFVCQQCGFESAKWLGKCPDCGEWNSFVESVSTLKTSSKKTPLRASGAKPQALESISGAKKSRTSTKIAELDRVLGGGIVPGQVVLLAGEPGVGKSTILLQLAEKLASVLYVSGEESAQQIKIRAERLGVKSKNISILEETDIDSIIESSKTPEFQNSKLLIVDSIQTMTTGDLSGMAGSVGQVRECASRLVTFAKRNRVPVVIVGHVTKQGSVAGPAVLAHIVDTVLWFEGDKSLTLRLLRAVKNRFGPTDEVGIFTMEGAGLIEVKNIDSLFIDKEESKKSIPGSCISSIMEGTRPILVEVQSLVVPTKLAFPKRTAQGIDSKRVELLLAILQRRAGLPMYEFDVFVNVAGGIKVREPGTDLAVALSIASSYFDKALPKNLVAVGELGLLGEIRPVIAEGKRLKEARRLGYKTIVDSKEKFISQAIKKYLR